MGKIKCVEIEINERNNINWALKKFKRQCEAYGIVKEYKKRKAHKKPSIKKKEKLEAAEKRRMKEERKFRSKRHKI